MDWQCVIKLNTLFEHYHIVGDIFDIRNKHE